MDNFLIMLVIFGIIIWWDNFRRKKRILDNFNKLGNYKFSVMAGSREETPKLSTEQLEQQLWKVRDALLADKPKVEYTPLEPMELFDVNIIEDAKTALKKLGYKQTDIKMAIDVIMDTTDDFKDVTAASIVQRALIILHNKKD